MDHPLRSPRDIAPGKQTLLDAAEELFSRHGYHGATMREITSLAGVPHGLATYHFRSKDDLFEQVVTRRGPAVLALLDQSLTAALSANGAPAATVEAIIQAYIGAHLGFAALGRREAMYLRLTQQIYALGRRRELIGDFVAAVEPVHKRYMAELARAVRRDPVDIEIPFYFLRLVLAGILIDVQLPAPLDLAQIESVTRHICTFCAGGFVSGA